MEDVVVKKGVLEAVSLFQAKHDVRYYLLGARFTQSGGKLRIEATNGHILISVEKDTDSKSEFEVLCPIPATGLPGKVSDEVELIKDGDYLTFRNDTQGTQRRIIDTEKFPDFRKITDEVFPPTGVLLTDVGISPDYMNTVARAWKKIHQAFRLNYSHGIRLVWNSNGPIKVEDGDNSCLPKLGCNVTMVVMPILVSSDGAGE